MYIYECIYIYTHTNKETNMYLNYIITSAALSAHVSTELQCSIHSCMCVCAYIYRYKYV